MFWAEALWATSARPAEAAGLSVSDYMADRATDGQRLAALEAAMDRLTQVFGGWQVPWSEINRYQRIDGAIVQKFDDAKPSIPVPRARRADLGQNRLRIAFDGQVAELTRPSMAPPSTIGILRTALSRVSSTASDTGASGGKVAR